MNLELTKQAEKDLASLSREQRDRVIAALDKLQTDSHGCDLKKLKGQTDIWRLRIGDHRALLKTDKQTQTLYVLTIKPRSTAYR